MTVAMPLANFSSGSVAQIVPLSQVPQHWDAAWEALANDASEPNPFAESWFVRPAIRHLGVEPQDKMISVWHGSALIGLVPVTTTARYGRMPIRHVENWIHYHCFAGTPLIRRGAEWAFWSVVIDALDRADWARNFVHIVGLNADGPVHQGLCDVRRADIVHQSERAMLSSTLDPESYHIATVRPKKRKELRRLRSRLDQLGQVKFCRLVEGDRLTPWIDNFLALESSGWKGRDGSALKANPATSAFFSEAIEGASRTGRLDMTCLAVDDKPIAMLVNFMTPPGAFAFKIAFDETFARFSPGVLLAIEYHKGLNRDDIDWTDSCAAEDHPMINSLWGERRKLVRVTVPLSGTRRQAVFQAARTIETIASKLRRAT